MEKMEKWVNVWIHMMMTNFQKMWWWGYKKEIYSHITQSHEYVTIFWASVLL